MATNASSLPGPLNPGNVVSAALRLYRDRFKTYLSLSARATLWVLVPVYGWAKYLMYSGVMSRLAFQELINQPETQEQAYRQVNPKLWSFLGLGLLVGLIFFGAYLALLVTGLIGSILIGAILGVVLPVLMSSEVSAAIAAVVGVVFFMAIFFLGLIWLLGRLLIAEVPLAIETQTHASDGITRSWQLTKLSIVRIQFVAVAAILITLPINVVMGLGPQLALLRVEFDSPAYWTLYTLALVLSFAGGILTLPFWQAVKGVLYYDLCSRREGLDIKL